MLADVAQDGAESLHGGPAAGFAAMSQVDIHPLAYPVFHAVHR